MAIQPPTILQHTHVRNRIVFNIMAHIIYYTYNNKGVFNSYTSIKLTGDLPSNDKKSVLMLLNVTVELSEVELTVTLQLYSPAFEAARGERERVLPC